MKIITWNVNGIRACAKKGLEVFVQQHRPDVFCIQETKAHIDQVEPQLQSLSYSNFLWSSAVKKGYSGVATFTNIPTAKMLKGWGQAEYDSEGRIVITQFPQFDLYNIYFPNGGSGEERHHFKQKFLKDLNQHLSEKLKQNRQIVLVGDYNVAHKEMDVHDPKRLSSESGFLPEEREWFDSFLKLGFIDTFRHFHPHESERYSWWSYREVARINNRGWRIDYICVSQGLEKNLISAEILDHIEGSDHCPVVCEFWF